MAFKRLDLSDLFLPARLWRLRVLQSPKTAPPTGRKLQTVSLWGIVQFSTAVLVVHWDLTFMVLDWGSTSVYRTIRSDMCKFICLDLESLNARFSVSTDDDNCKRMKAFGFQMDSCQCFLYDDRVKQLSEVASWALLVRHFSALPAHLPTISLTLNIL